MVERVSGYDGVELVVGEHEAATAPAIAAPRRHARAARRAASRCSTCSARGLPRARPHGRPARARSRVRRPRWWRSTAIDEVVRLGARRGAHDPWARRDDVVRGRRPRHGLGRDRAGAGARAPRRRGVGHRRERGRARGRARQPRRGRARPRPGCGWRPAIVVRRAAREALRGRLRLVVSNPPYVAEHEVADLPADVADWEPRRALVSGPSGTGGHRGDRRRRARLARSRGRRARRASSRRTRPTPRSGLATAAGFDDVGVVPRPRRPRPRARRPGRRPGVAPAAIVTRMALWPDDYEGLREEARTMARTIAECLGGRRGAVRPIATSASGRNARCSPGWRCRRPRVSTRTSPACRAGCSARSDRRRRCTCTSTAAP